MAPDATIPRQPLQLQRKKFTRKVHANAGKSRTAAKDPTRGRESATTSLAPAKAADKERQGKEKEKGGAKAKGKKVKPLNLKNVIRSPSPDSLGSCLPDFLTQREDFQECVAAFDLEANDAKFHQTVKQCFQKLERTEMDMKILVRWSQQFEFFKMFQSTPDRLYNLLQSLEFHSFASNQVIIRKGEIGTTFWFVFSGSVEVHLGKGGIPVTTYTKGSSFGELTLSFGYKRTATFVTREPSEFLVLHKADYDRSLRRGLNNQWEDNIGKIKSIYPFQSWHRSSLAELLSYMGIESFKAGEVVIEQDSKPDKMYIITEGMVKVEMAIGFDEHFTMPVSKEEFAVLRKSFQRMVEVSRIEADTPYSIVGEKALVEGTKRVARVTAVTDVETLVLSKRHFDRVITGKTLKKFREMDTNYTSLEKIRTEVEEELKWKKLKRDLVSKVLVERESKCPYEESMRRRRLEKKKTKFRPKNAGLLTSRSYPVGHSSEELLPQVHYKEKEVPVNPADRYGLVNRAELRDRVFKRPSLTKMPSASTILNSLDAFTGTMYKKKATGKLPPMKPDDEEDEGDSQEELVQKSIKERGEAAEALEHAASKSNLKDRRAVLKRAASKATGMLSFSSPRGNPWGKFKGDGSPGSPRSPRKQPSEANEPYQSKWSIAKRKVLLPILLEKEGMDEKLKKKAGEKIEHIYDIEFQTLKQKSRTEVTLLSNSAIVSSMTHASSFDHTESPNNYDHRGSAATVSLDTEGSSYRLYEISHQDGPLLRAFRGDMDGSDDIWKEHLEHRKTSVKVVPSEPVKPTKSFENSPADTPQESESEEDYNSQDTLTAVEILKLAEKQHQKRERESQGPTVLKKNLGRFLTAEERLQRQKAAEKERKVVQSISEKIREKMPEEEKAKPVTLTSRKLKRQESTLSDGFPADFGGGGGALGEPNLLDMRTTSRVRAGAQIFPSEEDVPPPST